MEYFFWITFSIFIAVFANKRKRSGVGFFFLSMLTSPLIALLILLLVENRSKQSCGECGARIPLQVNKCRECGSKLNTEAPLTQERGVVEAEEWRKAYRARNGSNSDSLRGF